MATLPRLSPQAEHRIVKAVCGLPPAIQRRLFGCPRSLDGKTLASDIHALLKMAEMSGGVSAMEGMTPAEARQANRDGVEVINARPPIPMARVEALEVPGPAGPVPARFYVPGRLPAGEPAPLLVYYHAGGWVIGDLETHDGVCRFLAAAAGVAVLSIDYRLAPEHPFPAAVVVDE